MIITISGNAGSGKDTAGDLLGKKLNLPVIKATMKTFAKERGMDVLEFEKKIKEAGDSPEFDYKLDSWQKEKVKETGDCVLVSMMAAYNFPNADLKVWLHAPENVRAERMSNRDGVSKKKALGYVRARDLVFRKRIKKIYGFDWWAATYYDLVINTEKWLPDQVVEIITTALKNRREM